MSLLNPGIPPQYQAVQVRSASFGAEAPLTPKEDSSLMATIVIGGVVGLLAVLTINSIMDEGAKGEGRIGGADADILDRIRAEKAARDMSFSKAAYHSAKVHNMSRALDQKARLSTWKAGK